MDAGNGPVVGADGAPELIGDPDVEGMIALRRGWPSMFRDYLHDHERYERSFAGDWYLSGDLARRDADGWFWFVGRADDVIKTAGHLIGPFEVESALMEHDAVVEAGVIGIPDEVAGNVVKAFVTVRPGIEVDEQLELDLRGFARTRLGAAVGSTVDRDRATSCPTPAAARSCVGCCAPESSGLPEGDLSTLEEQR